jgi:hypothetical protein
MKAKEAFSSYGKRKEEGDTRMYPLQYGNTKKVTRNPTTIIKDNYNFVNDKYHKMHAN